MIYTFINKIMKVCYRCKQEKSAEDFYKSKHTKDNLTSWCKVCTIQRARESNKLKDRETNREYQRTWRAQNPSRQKNYYLQSYGLTVEKYDLMLTQQNYSCAICKIPASQCKRSLSVDHNHTTNAVRGLLCDSCNLMIGNAREQPTILKNGIFYLEAFS